MVEQSAIIPDPLGQFGKAEPGSVHLSFAPSAETNCDIGCPLKSGGCYATAVERHRPNLYRKLLRHAKMHPAQLLVAAMHRLNRRRRDRKLADVVPWVRLSSFGSLPQPKNADARFRAALKLFARFIVSQSMQDKTHVPVETARKANWYRKFLPGLTVRESTHTRRRWLTAIGAVSAHTPSAGPLLERIKTAKEWARDRRQRTGRTVCVCPAVVSGFMRKLGRKSTGAKCGTGRRCCSACALPHVDVVYPGH